MAALPDEVNLVGGPYCGFVIRPHDEIVQDVQKLENNGFKDPELEYSEPPYRFDPVDTETLVVWGELGQAVYRMESSRFWRFTDFLPKIPLTAPG